MGKKDKKIEVQLVDSNVKVNKTEVEGYQLMIGKRLVGEIAEIDGKFAVVKDKEVSDFHKNLETAIEAVIGAYNLNN
ncbi:DUF2969 domain-containing protein [Streptococcus macacae]|uniref:PF11184 family protein n=1 Tax=Streptococcus macacae NCTC 11558 TaxID=764298 RepID=G5JUH0_9STRE|nr:DUF2969 domain-containing protein [Streptococcus macacae]EHJ51604.1 hypothetical protein STRMA_0797 [Streptococcus macacae NCTC 11558]SUN78612.1 branched-chain amino acid aminotransferase [Streptococcus macacae NCTC 11558]